MGSIGYLSGDIIEGFTTAADEALEAFGDLRQTMLSTATQFRSFTTTFNLVEVHPATLRLLYGLPAERCDYSWLWPEQCAHCLGHELGDDVPVQQA